MKQLFKLTGCLYLGLFASANRCNRKPTTRSSHYTRNCNRSRKSFILKSSVKILYPEGNEKMQRKRKILADYLKTAGKDFAIEAGTEGKNAIV